MVEAERTGEHKEEDIPAEDIPVAVDIPVEDIPVADTHPLDILLVDNLSRITKHTPTKIKNKNRSNKT